AFKTPENAIDRDRAADRAHLLALLDHYGAPHPKEAATHYAGDVGQFHLKWESYTEFVTFTFFLPVKSGDDFDTPLSPWPEGWLGAAPGSVLTKARIRVENRPAIPTLKKHLKAWFVEESLAVSNVLENALTIAGDFRLDALGNMRFAVFPDPETGVRRIGRVVQRLCEIETYKVMSMLGFARCAEINDDLGRIDHRLEELADEIRVAPSKSTETLDGLLQVSGELEHLLSRMGYRFGATKAYRAIVEQRVEALREARFEGMQSFGEFMMRRYDPAMRSVVAAKERLEGMSERAVRAGDLLRTRVDVERSAQNQALLASMDRRADLALRLQQTVEGLSVVAIGYYAVNLATYLFYPVAKVVGMGKTTLTSMLTVPTLLLVWLMVRQIKKKMH
ncbi:MAG: DUF3422 family protein, partial [Halocynthiibacter sp.]